MTDSVNARLLGINKIVSDDYARKALQKIVEEEDIRWLQHSLYYPRKISCPRFLAQALDSTALQKNAHLTDG